MTIFINHTLYGLLIFPIWDQGVTINFMSLDGWDHQLNFLHVSKGHKYVSKSHKCVP
jgi:hypothetical protein